MAGWVAGRRLVAVDGTCLDVADTAVNEAFFGRPGVTKGERAAFPQARDSISGSSWMCCALKIANCSRGWRKVYGCSKTIAWAAADRAGAAELDFRI